MRERERERGGGGRGREGLCSENSSKLYHPKKQLINKKIVMPEEGAC